jgi:hypothetical protein
VFVHDDRLDEPRRLGCERLEGAVELIEAEAVRNQATRPDLPAPDQLEPPTDRVVEEVPATNVP